MRGTFVNIIANAGLTAVMRVLAVGVVVATNAPTTTCGRSSSTSAMVETAWITKTVNQITVTVELALFIKRKTPTRLGWRGSGGASESCSF